MKSETEFIELPGDLIKEMNRLDKSMAVLTPAVDGRVVEAAAAHFAQRPLQAPRPQQVSRPQRMAGPTRRWAMAGTLAASLVIGVLLVRMQTGIETQRLASDIDGSGVVDILDAFALARLNSGQSSAAQVEIDSFIMEIVSLNGTPL